MKEGIQIGAFCETYGQTIPNRVLEYILENQDLDIAAGDIARAVGISRPKAYEVMMFFEAKGYVKQSRVVGRTQLYLLNKANRRVQLFMRNFLECLKIVAEEHQERLDYATTPPRTPP
jgi:sugar-specific transcriptional regulator TrmB